jgi:hypothetical protein
MHDDRLYYFSYFAQNILMLWIHKFTLYET